MKYKFISLKKLIFILIPIFLIIYFLLKHENKPVIIPFVNPKLICNIDSISGYTLNDNTYHTHTRLNSILFNGWVAIPNLNLSPNKVEVLLLSPSAGKFLIFNDYTFISRNDVSISFDKEHLLDNSGFSISSRFSKDMANTSYNIYILAYFDGFTGMCSIKQNIIF
jgi:hypothetical protein